MSLTVLRPYGQVLVTFNCSMARKQPICFQIKGMIQKLVKTLGPKNNDINEIPQTITRMKSKLTFADAPSDTWCW